jgi:hypothetical protein
LTTGYEELILELLKRHQDDPLLDTRNFKKENWITKIAMHIAAYDVLEKETSSANGFVTDGELVLYGIYQLKISPNDFASKEEYIREVMAQNEKLITEEQQYRYLHYLLDLIKNCENYTADELYSGVTARLKMVYGVKISMKYKTKKQLARKLEAEINRLLALKVYQKKLVTLLNKSTLQTSLIVVGAVAAVGALAFFLRKKFTK